MAAAYGGHTGRDILHAVPQRVHIAADGVRAAVAQGDEEMRNLVLMGEPARNEHALGELLNRIDDIERELP